MAETKKNKQIKLNLKRINGETFIIFKVDKKVEQIFKKQSTEIKESASWEGLSFYSVPELTTDENYKRLLQRWQLIDDFGTSLYAGGTFNIAFLRTVGGSGEIKVRGDIGYSAVSIGIERILGFLKEYYGEYLRDYKVNATLTLEI